MMNDGVYVCSPPGATPVWFEHFAAEDENLAACLLEEWTLTQPCGSASELENQIQGQSDESLTTGDYGVLATHPQRTSRETMNPQRLAALFFEKPSPTQPCGSGSTRVDTVGLPGPSSSQGIDDLTTQGFLANSPQETVNRRRNKRENGERRQRGSNWSPEETSCFLKHMKTAVVGEKHKPPWRAVSEAMKLDGYNRSKKATENRWGVLLALDTDSYTDNNDSISSSRGLPVGWRQSMMSIHQDRPRKLRSAPTPATPPSPSPSSGSEIEVLSSFIAKIESIDDQIFRLIMKKKEMLRKQTKSKTRKRKDSGRPRIYGRQ